MRKGENNLGKIEEKMEEIRKQLINLINNKDSSSKEKILEVSQELDKVICEYIKLKNTR